MILFLQKLRIQIRVINAHETRVLNILDMKKRYRLLGPLDRIIELLGLKIRRWVSRCQCIFIVVNSIEFVVHDIVLGEIKVLGRVDSDWHEVDIGSVEFIRLGGHDCGIVELKDN